MQENGAVPAPSLELEARALDTQTSVERIQQELAALVASEAEAVKELTAKATEARGRLAQYTRALAAMTGEPAKAQGRPAQAKPARRSDSKWQGTRASQGVRDKITAALADGQARTVKEITEATGYTDSAIRKGLDDLRTDQAVRRTGQPGRRGANGARRGFRYALMPEDPANAT